MSGLKIFTDVDSSFSDLYLKVREKEERVYEDSLVRFLPNVPTHHPQYNEWQQRKKSANRFIDYVKLKSVNRILEIGCGNGWFTNMIAKNNYANVYGIDVNKRELEQAERIFIKDNLHFGYGDIFSNFTKQPFDIIVLNSSVQYFPNIERLLTRLNELLVNRGEIHILDSPIYGTSKKAEEAKRRSEEYFTKAGFPEMANHYYHHHIGKFKNFGWKYRPSLLGVVNKFKKTKENPFPWIFYVKKGG